MFPLFSGVNVIEILYDIYAISNSGPPRDAYARRYVSPATALHTKRNVITLRIPSMKWSRNSVTNA